MFDRAERDFSEIYRVYEQRPTGVLVSDLTLKTDPFEEVPSHVRPLSATAEDFGWGDGGKGHKIQEINHLMLEKLRRRNEFGETRVYSMRVNGSDNAGHEVIENSQDIALHQLPVAVTQEGTVGIMKKGMLLHPVNLVTEMEYVKKKLDGQLWGDLWIDENVIVVTDLHRAFEQVTNNFLGTGKGATGSGISQGYSSYLEKRALFMRDFIADDWEEKFGKTYDYFAMLVGGADILADITVKNLDEYGGRLDRKVGSKEEHLDRLREARTKLTPYVKDVNPLLADIWRDSSIPVTIEIAQGDALDSIHGVYPDNTASRTIGRINIPDATEGIIFYGDIAVHTGVVKIPYLSSVGSRKHPYGFDKEEEVYYRDKFGEYGKSTGRARHTLPVDAVRLQYSQLVARRKHIGYTHLDAGSLQYPARVVTHYISKKDKSRVPFRPYQWHWDQVEGVVEDYPGWDGEAAEQARSVEDIPREAIIYMLAIAHNIGAKPVMATNGPHKGDVIYFFEPK